MSESHSKEPSQEEVENFGRQVELSRKIAKKAFEELGIPKDVPEDYPQGGARWRLYSGEHEEELVLSIQFDLFGSEMVMHVRFSRSIQTLLDELEKLLADPSARMYFDVEDADVEDVVFDRILDLSKGYIRYLPPAFFHAFCQVTSEVIIDHIKKVVEPMYRWDDLDGVGDPIKLLPTNNLSDLSDRFPDVDFLLFRFLKETEDQLGDFRKDLRRGRKVYLTHERFKNLNEEYTKLRRDYEQVKKKFKEQRDAYAVLHADSLAGWTAHWDAYMEKFHADLSFSHNNYERAPSQLAYRHLAWRYDYSEKTMERKVIESRTLAKEHKARAARRRQSPPRPKKPTSDAAR
ncbi:MAG: hypothetical protein ABIO36_05915 [Pyrinomonadaceae bacterium]